MRATDEIDLGKLREVAKQYNPATLAEAINVLRDIQQQGEKDEPMPEADYSAFTRPVEDELPADCFYNRLVDTVKFIEDSKTEF
jgi:hypothetical protein